MIKVNEVKAKVRAAIPAIRARGLPVPDCTERICPELGCGFFGCVFKTDNPGIVMKFTKSKNEAQFLSFIRENSDRPGFGIIKAGFPEIGHVAINNESDSDPFFLIWREEVNPDWEEYYPEDSTEYDRIDEALETIGYALGRKTHEYRRIEDALRIMTYPLARKEAFETRVERLSEIRSSSLTWIEKAYAELFEKYGLVIWDIHRGNISVPLRQSREERPKLVIHDLDFKHLAGTEIPPAPPWPEMDDLGLGGDR